MGKHTPGPWRTDENGSIVCYPEGLAVGVLSKQLPEAERQANHSLIVACPDLLDIVCAILDEIPEGDVGVQFSEDFVAKMKVTLAKAEGRHA